MSNGRAHGLGVTQIAIGLSATVQVTAQAYQTGWVFKKFSGSSLAIVNGISNIASEGYMVGDTESINVDGPATFFLAAAGATCVVHCLWGDSAGAP